MSQIASADRASGLGEVANWRGEMRNQRASNVTSRAENCKRDGAGSMCEWSKRFAVSILRRDRNGAREIFQIADFTPHSHGLDKTFCNSCLSREIVA